MRRALKGEKRDISDQTVASKEYEVTEHQLLEQMMKIESDSYSWCKAAIQFGGSTTLASSSLEGQALSAETANTELMQHIQDSFDATTRLTLSVKRMVQELIKSSSGSMTKSYIEKALSLCKALVPGSEKVEALLTTPPSEILKREASAVLREAAKPFMDLEVFAKELEAQHKMFCKKMRSI